MVGVVWVRRPGRMGMGEFSRFRFAENDSPGISKPLDAGRILAGLEPAVEIGVVLGRHVRGIDDVLDADRDALERPIIARIVKCAGLVKGRLASHACPGFHAGLAFVNPIEMAADHSFDSRLAGAHRHMRGGGGQSTELAARQ